MINYANAKIYKIYSPHHPLPYIGSTTQQLQLRLYQHIHSNVSYSITPIIQAGDCVIQLLEHCPCKDAKAARERERFYIESIPCINHNVPNQTSAERYLLHREEYAQRYLDNVDATRQYYQEHIEQRRKYTKDREDWIRLCGGLNLIRI